MWAFTNDTVIRAERLGALMFNRGSAETAYLDREALAFLRDLFKGDVKGGSVPMSTLVYLKKAGMIAEGRGVDEASVAEVEGCLEAEVVDLPNALAAPETLHLALTNTCDQVCPGCFYSRKEGEPGGFMSEQTFGKILEGAKAARVFQFAFGGGEPLINPRALAFARMSTAAGIVPNVTSNGNNLTEELAVGLKDAGLGQFQISLDGAEAELASRTRPNYEQALAAMELCGRVGLRFGINALVTRENFRSLPKLFRLARERGAEGVNLLRPKPPVNASEWLGQSSLTAGENEELRGLLREKGGGTRVTLDQSLSFLARHRDPAELYANGVWGCGAGRRFATIDWDGTVYGCSHYRKPIGAGADFMKAWVESELLYVCRTLEDTIGGACGGCRMASVCRGCRAVVVELGGGFHDDDLHCPIKCKEGDHDDFKDA